MAGIYDVVKRIADHLANGVHALAQPSDWGTTANKPASFTPATHGNPAHSSTFATTTDVSNHNNNDVHVQGQPPQTHAKTKHDATTIDGGAALPVAQLPAHDNTKHSVTFPYIKTIPAPYSGTLTNEANIRDRNLATAAGKTTGDLAFDETAYYNPGSFQIIRYRAHQDGRGQTGNWQAFQLWVSQDGITWTLIEDWNVGTTSGDSIIDKTVLLPAIYSYIKIRLAAGSTGGLKGYSYCDEILVA